jgi:hypothetical protein
MFASLIGFLSVFVVVFLGQHAFTGRKPSFASALNVYQKNGNAEHARAGAERVGGNAARVAGASAGA